MSYFDTMWFGKPFECQFGKNCGSCIHLVHEMTISQIRKMVNKNGASNVMLDCRFSTMNRNETRRGTNQLINTYDGTRSTGNIGLWLCILLGRHCFRHVLPYAQPGHWGGSTLAKPSGIKPNFAMRLRMLKLKWPRVSCVVNKRNCFRLTDSMTESSGMSISSTAKNNSKWTGICLTGSIFLIQVESQ